MKLDSTKTALLTLDLQKEILASIPDSESVIPNASKTLEIARKNRFQIIHIGFGFSEGHPEIPDTESLFLRVKQNNLFLKGSPTAEFHDSIIQPGDTIVYKQRVGAFSENQLHLILRSKGIENLILLGVVTSGIVLSTLERAFDLDFRCIIIADACFDLDSEVHRVLCEKVFPKQSKVLTVADFIAELE